MLNRSFRDAIPAALLVILLVGLLAGLAQNAEPDARNSGRIADEIGNTSERIAFIALYKDRDPARMLKAAQQFLQLYPRSAFLAQAYEIAARASFDQKQNQTGLDYAKQSLSLLPENPLLLVAVADAQAKQLQDDAAIASAEDALAYLDRFGRPDSISEGAWPEVRRRQQATANFVIGRADLHKSLLPSMSGLRRSLLEESAVALKNGNSLDPENEEIAFLLGSVQLSLGRPMAAANRFASLYSEGGEYAQKSFAILQKMYQVLPWGTNVSFDVFLKNAGNYKEEEPSPPDMAASSDSSSAAALRTGYAGSTACRQCHSSIYKNWSQTGMARMLQPYRPENVLGDFTKNNTYYTGQDVRYLHGEFSATPGNARRLFAQMVERNGRHYFEIRQTDGTWHSYPVDYTIGCKWQQAYATTLPDGRVHVFPIEYSLRKKEWLNYWGSIDGPGSERTDSANFEKLDESTDYLTRCAVCHTSQLLAAGRKGIDTFQLKFREPGIDCEMCHGPSALHISSMIAGTEYKKRPLDPPVDFSKIGNRDFVQICAQCHMQSALRDAGAGGELNYSTTGKFYRVNRSLPYDEFSRRGFYKDGRFGQTTFIVEALERSQCYRKGKVSCGDCHDPHSHDFAENQTSLKFKGQPDRMCTGCHTQFADSATMVAHTHHGGASEGSRCVSCHMPAIMDALGFEARTHQIDDIPNAELTLRYGQRDSPNACLLCHTGKDAAWVQGQLQTWKRNATDAAPVAAAR